MADLLVEKHGATTVFTINRPDRMNVLSRTVSEDLAAGIRELNQDPNQSVGIITGAGEKAFCAGGDLKDMAESASAGTSVPLNPWPDIAGVAASEKPVIAAVNGLAVAGGLELSISCDIRLASTNAWFGVFEVKRGILAGVAVNILPRLMPIGAVMDLMLSADRMSVDDAYRLGLVQKIAEPDKLMEAALEKADMIAANSPIAVWATKAVLKYWRDLQIAEHQKFYESAMQRVLLAGDFLEGPRAFAEKRAPVFRSEWPSPFEPDGRRSSGESSASAGATTG